MHINVYASGYTSVLLTALLLLFGPYMNMSHIYNQLYIAFFFF